MPVLDPNILLELTTNATLMIKRNDPTHSIVEAVIVSMSTIFLVPLNLI